MCNDTSCQIRRRQRSYAACSFPSIIIGGANDHHYDENAATRGDAPNTQ